MLSPSYPQTLKHGTNRFVGTGHLLFLLSLQRKLLPLKELFFRLQYAKV